MEMTNELAVVEENHFTESQVDLIKRTIMHRDATNDELQLFLYQAERTGLDPLSRQIHAIFRYNKSAGRNVMTVQTGIDGYRLIADRTGKYAGSDDYLFNDGKTQYEMIVAATGFPLTATVTVYKIVGGMRVPFTATAEWQAYFPGDSQGFMWKKMPYLMLGKCAEALALRKAFPAELSGIYTTEEMAQAGEIVDVSVTETTPSNGKQEKKQKKESEPTNDVDIAALDSEDIKIVKNAAVKLATEERFPVAKFMEFAAKLGYKREAPQIKNDNGGDFNLAVLTMIELSDKDAEYDPNQQDQSELPF